MDTNYLVETNQALNKVLSEGTWAVPFEPAKAKKLAVLMKKPISSEEFKKKGYNLVGDDDLFDFFYELEKDGEADDVRGAVLDTVEKWLDLHDKDPSRFSNDVDDKTKKFLRSLIKKYGYK